MLNRSIPPNTYNNVSVNLIEPLKHTLSNGCKIVQFPYKEQKILQLSIYFPSGKWFQNKPAISQLTAQMLLEGTKSLNNKQLIDAFESYGAYIFTNSEFYNAKITVFCLQKHLTNILALLNEIIAFSNFPQKQLDIILHNKKQHLAVNLKRVDFIAQREFFKSIFPKNYPYALVEEKEDYDNISRQMLQSFYKTYYNLSKSTISVIGDINQDDFSIFEEFFSKAQTNTILPLDNQKAKKTFIEKTDAKQSAIIIGKLFPNLTHQDYYKLKILNTILGGYFGSRLMKNIREKKGYTYGIFSNINSLPQTGIFYISSQVKSEYTNASIIEINNEIHRLQETLISQKELQLVKNYQLGQILQSCNGPFNQLSLYMNTSLYNINLQLYIENAIRTINDITREDIRTLAQIYLNTDELHQVVVGKL